MAFTAWLKRRRQHGDKRRTWRAACAAAVDAGEPQKLEELRAELAQLDKDGGDVEIELEMLEALERIAELQQLTAESAVPVVETQHRVIGSEVCHFTAPASVPSDAAQRSGRVLFTGTRSLFVGGGPTSALPWHSVHHILRTERDVVFARADGTGGAHFRFNTYSDAAEAVFLARKLRESRTPRAV